MSMVNGSEVTIVRGACPHDCPDTCATLVEVRNGEAIGFRADPDHPITQGWLCAKVRPYLQRVYAPDRLQYPMRRTGAKGGGEWTRISWDEAIARDLPALAVDHRRVRCGRHPALLVQRDAGAVADERGESRLWNRMGACGLERRSAARPQRPRSSRRGWVGRPTRVTRNTAA